MLTLTLKQKKRQRLACSTLTTNTRHSPKIGSMLCQRHRGQANIEPSLAECLVFAGLSQQIRDVHPTLLQCLPTISDAGTTVKQHWRKVSCLQDYRLECKNPTQDDKGLRQDTAKTLTNTGLMLDHCLQYWTIITTSLGQKTYIICCVSRCCFNAGRSSTTLDQTYPSIGCSSHVRMGTAEFGFLMPNKHETFCITFVQSWTNVEDVGPALYKCYANVSCLMG